MTIRTPHPSEYAIIAEIINSEIDLYKHVFTPQELASVGIGMESARGLEEASTRRHYRIAVLHGEIVGFASWYSKTKTTAWVSMLHVSTSARGKGIGSQLLVAIEQEVATMGHTALALETNQKATWAVRFYERQGYHVLSWADLQTPPYNELLTRPPVAGTYVFGKQL